MGRRFMLISILILLTAISSFAQERICTPTEAQAAERSALLEVRALSWPTVYDSFKRFGHCDDGSVGEKYSDSIVRLLATRWDQLSTLRRLVLSDGKFHDFVLRHIDATTDEDDLKKVAVSARARCPAVAKTLCTSIEMRTDSALRGIHKTN
jgi:hypothetical protein